MCSGGQASTDRHGALLSRHPPSAADLAETFDAVAEGYAAGHESTRVDGVVRAEILRRVTARLPRGASILDAGCGPGLYAIPLAQAGYRVLAVDVSPRMVACVAQNARAAGVEVTAICGDVESCLAGIEPLDAAISVHGPVAYTSDPGQLIRALARAVCPGGPVWLALPRAASLEQLIKSPRETFRRAFSPLLSAEGLTRIEGQLGGRRIVVHVRDPLTFARAIAPWIQVDEIAARGVVLHLPERIDATLGRSTVLRRFGASTILAGRVVTRTA